MNEQFKSKRMRTRNGPSGFPELMSISTGTIRYRIFRKRRDALYNYLNV